MTVPEKVEVGRLEPGDRQVARETFALMAEVFGEERGRLSDGYLDRLLGRSDFWALAGVADGRVVGGLTAHVLATTTSEGSELFVYDVAVHPDHQRRGCGRRLVDELLRLAHHGGVGTVFVLADDDDAHALDFYRALGAAPSAVTLFELGAGRDAG